MLLEAWVSPNGDCHCPSTWQFPGQDSEFSEGCCPSPCFWCPAQSRLSVNSPSLNAWRNTGTHNLCGTFGKYGVLRLAVEWGIVFYSLSTGHTSGVPHTCLTPPIDDSILWSRILVTLYYITWTTVLNKHSMNEWMNRGRGWGMRYPSTSLPQSHSGKACCVLALMPQTFSMNCKLYDLRGLTPSSLMCPSSAKTLAGKGMSPRSPVHCACPTLTGTFIGKFKSKPQNLRS